MKDIPGWEGLYQVSKKGEVWSNRSAKWLKANVTRKGYVQVYLCNMGKGKNHRIHRLVASAWIPNPEAKPFINHKNLDKRDNRVENLEWCTNIENSHHYMRSINKDFTPPVWRPKKPDTQIGVYNSNCKMTVEEITAIRSSNESTQKLADKYGLTQSYVSKIKRGVVWQSLARY